eukprot:Gregarina_sp_Poly_1__10742@NODE_819_length_6147_cov_44_607072_g593_i0_p5_GENE_NODE_819_length_6147_cov_44_607072_g593_i0NODE_819_length_6147_cov_44_607072_g593_i0_p5_ORF_typecomplete_len200_score18_84_NODE_819_length_6147_cov_44_607072_g593_i029863585
MQHSARFSINGSYKPSVWIAVFEMLLALEGVAAVLRLYTKDPWGSLADILLVYSGYVAIRESSSSFFLIYLIPSIVAGCTYVSILMEERKRFGVAVDPAWPFRANLEGVLLVVAPVLAFSTAAVSFILYKICSQNEARGWINSTGAPSRDEAFDAVYSVAENHLPHRLFAESPSGISNRTLASSEESILGSVPLATAET